MVLWMITKLLKQATIVYPIIYDKICRGRKEKFVKNERRLNFRSLNTRPNITKTSIKIRELLYNSKKFSTIRPAPSQLPMLRGSCNAYQFSCKDSNVYWKISIHLQTTWWNANLKYILHWQILMNWSITNLFHLSIVLYFLTAYSNTWQDQYFGD